MADIAEVVLVEVHRAVDLVVSVEEVLVAVAQEDLGKTDTFERI